MGQDGTKKGKKRGGGGVFERRSDAAGDWAKVLSECEFAAALGEGTAERRNPEKAFAFGGDERDAGRCEKAAAGAVRSPSACEALGEDDRDCRRGHGDTNPKKIWSQVATIVGESENESLQILCRLLGYTRQAYYKRQQTQEREALAAEMVVREVLKVRRVQKRLGVRKVYHMIGPVCLEHGIKIGRDRLNELMRVYGLLVTKKRRKRPRTTISGPWKRYPNLIRDYSPTAANQIWVSDITYIRIGVDFGYLSLVTDAYSRKIVGYKLSESLSAKGCVAALRMAIKDNPERESLIHHSDRGTQYYSLAYMKLLGRKIRVSMTEKGDPLENAIAERVNGILKQELLEGPFLDFRDACEHLDKAVNVYNNQRPHMSIDMLTPAEAHTRSGPLKRHWKSYFSNANNWPIAQAMA